MNPGSFFKKKYLNPLEEEDRSIPMKPEEEEEPSLRFKEKWKDVFTPENPRKSRAISLNPIVTIKKKHKSLSWLMFFNTAFSSQHYDYFKLGYILPYLSKINNTILLNFCNRSSDPCLRKIYGKPSSLSISIHISPDFGGDEIGGKYSPELIDISEIGSLECKCWALDLSKKL